jgi:hypothetical protein
MNLPIIPEDKANHALYGLVIYALSASLFAPPFAMVAVFACAMGKELYDSVLKEKAFSNADMIATLCGGLVGMYIGLFT